MSMVKQLLKVDQPATTTNTNSNDITTAATALLNGSGGAATSSSNSSFRRGSIESGFRRGSVDSSMMRPPLRRQVSPSPSIQLTVTTSDSDDLASTENKQQLTNKHLPHHRHLLRKTTTDSSGVSSRRGSFRQKFSEASSIVSLYIRSPSKMLKNSMLLAALSAFLMALYGMLFGLIKDDIARATVTVTRGFLQLSLNLAASLFQGEELKIQHKDQVSSTMTILWVHFAMVVVFGGLRLCLIFAALQLTEMAIVHTILNGSPVMVMILAHFILSGSERLTWIKISSAAMLIFGVILNSNPIEAIQIAAHEKNFESAIGISLAILALIFSSLGSIYTKKVSNHFSKMQIGAAIGASITVFGLLSVLFDELFSHMRVMKMNYQFLEQHQPSQNDSYYNNYTDNEVSVSSLSSLLEDLPLTDLACLFNDNDHIVITPEVLLNETHIEDHMVACEVHAPPYFPADGNVWTTTVVVGLLGIAQQYCLIAAIKMGSPSRVSMMRSSSIIFSFVLQCSHSVVPDWNQWLGAAIILVAIFVNILEGTVKKKMVEFKKRFCSCCCKAEEGRVGDETDRKTAILKKIPPPGIDGRGKFEIIGEEKKGRQ